MAIAVAAAFVSGAFISSPELRAYAASTIGSADIINNSILSADIKDGEVKTVDLGANTVTSAKVKDGEIKSADIADAAVQTSDIGSNAINSAKIKNGDVMTIDLADNAVTSDKLADNVFDGLQSQIDALTAANAAQAAEIDGLTTRVEALEGGTGGGGNDPDIDDDGDNYSETEGDCDDDNSTVNPGAAEVAGNQIDDDCDGAVDEGTGTISPSGTYDISPVPDYDCAFGIVDFTISQFVFSGTSSTSVTGAPDDMTGPSASDGNIAVSGTIPGGCTETYSLTGSFVDPDTWTATFDAEYSGDDCDVFGLDKPCTNQSWSVNGTRVES
jgi:hypothetical protein